MTDDYEAMYAAGVRALVEPAFRLGLTVARKDEGERRRS